MEEKIDLRIQRTYKLLTDALLGMLKEMDFEQITVRELCERAMVRPATFYKHFADKYEFFTFTIRELLQEFMNSSEIRRDPAHPEQFHTGMMDQALRFMEENKSIMSHTIRGNASHVLLDLMSDQIRVDIADEFRKEQKEGIRLPGDPELMSVLYTGAIVNVIKWWAVQDFRPERAQLVRECGQIVDFGGRELQSECL